VKRHTEAVAYLYELLQCCELNMDDMDPTTLELIEEIHGWLDDVQMSTGRNTEETDPCRTASEPDDSLCVESAEPEIPPERRGFV
jgi:hypothetical protein